MEVTRWSTLAGGRAHPRERGGRPASCARRERRDGELEASAWGERSHGEEGIHGRSSRLGEGVRQLHVGLTCLGGFTGAGGVGCGRCVEFSLF